MLKRLLWGFLCVFFPWLVLLLEDNPGGALVALIMQATAVLWIPASMWAFRTVRESNARNHKKQKKASV